MIATYRTLLVGQFQQASQYRVSMFLYLLFSLIRPIIFLAAWDAVAVARGGAVGGFTAADFAGYYVCMALVLHFTTAWNAYESCVTDLYPWFPLMVGCAAQWTLQVESYWWQFISCSAFPFS